MLTYKLAQETSTQRYIMAIFKDDEADDKAKEKGGVNAPDNLLNLARKCIEAGIRIEDKAQLEPFKGLSWARPLSWGEIEIFFTFYQQELMK